MEDYGRRAYEPRSTRMLLEPVNEERRTRPPTPYEEYK